MIFKKIFIPAMALFLIPAALFSNNFTHIKDHMASYNKKYFIYVNKAQKRLYLIDRNMKVWSSDRVATGSLKGGKLYAGDLRTPSGFYHIVRICQYHEPWYLSQLREMTALYKYYSGQYELLYEKSLKNRRKMRDMNSVYLSAQDGHVKFGTDEDLGYDAYGPVFMLLDYPNSEDIERYNEAVKNGLLPVDDDGRPVDIGGGIAIHGTNDNPSIGNDASSGCVRMKNIDILELSDYVSEGTMVVID